MSASLRRVAGAETSKRKAYAAAMTMKATIVEPAILLKGWDEDSAARRVEEPARDAATAMAAAHSGTRASTKRAKPFFSAYSPRNASRSFSSGNPRADQATSTAEADGREHEQERCDPAQERPVHDSSRCFATCRRG